MKYLSNKNGFLGIDNKVNFKEKVVVVPFGLEKTVSYGGGTKNGPREIIKASHQVELYDEELNCEPYKKIGIKTLKPFKIDKNIKKALNKMSKINQEILDKKLFPMTFGGEHSITPGCIAPFVKKYKAKHVVYDVMSVSAMLDANLESYNRRVIPTYRFEKADVVASFAADFLGNWLDAGHGKSFAARRNPNNGSMSRHYQFESNLSLTGANADYRTPVKASEMGVVLLNLYNLLSLKAGVSSVKVALSDHSNTLKKMANDLWNAKGKSLVIAGGNNIHIHLIVNAINDLLDNTGKTIDFSIQSNLKQGKDQDITALIHDMNNGQVGSLIAYNVNPAYNLAQAEEFKQGLSKVDLSVSFAEKLDETAAQMNFVCPDHNYLESWNDANPYTGIYALVQPTIHPLFNTRQAQVSLMSWTGLGDDYYNFLQDYWRNNILGSTFLDSNFSGFTFVIIFFSDD